MRPNLDLPRVVGEYEDVFLDELPGLLLSGSEYVHKFITQLPKNYYLIPGNGAIKLVDRI